jgi:hypothetical protein
MIEPVIAAIESHRIGSAVASRIPVIPAGINSFWSAKAPEFLHNAHIHIPVEPLVERAGRLIRVSIVIFSTPVLIYKVDVGRHREVCSQINRHIGVQCISLQELVGHKTFLVEVGIRNPRIEVIP